MLLSRQMRKTQTTATHTAEDEPAVPTTVHVIFIKDHKRDLRREAKNAIITFYPSIVKYFARAVLAFDSNAFNIAPKGFNVHSLIIKMIHEDKDSHAHTCAHTHTHTHARTHSCTHAHTHTHTHT